MTFRRTFLIGLLPALSIGLYAGHLTLPDKEPSFSTPAPIEIFEDGSAIMTDGTTRPEDTYEWDCMTMGNRICGPN